MRSVRRLALVAIAMLAVTPAFGGLVGEEAPDFKVEGTVNEAPALDLKEMKGEVILIKYWGTK